MLGVTIAADAAAGCLRLGVVGLARGGVAWGVWYGADERASAGIRGRICRLVDASRQAKRSHLPSQDNGPTELF